MGLLGTLVILWFFFGYKAYTTSQIIFKIVILFILFRLFF